jgi:hypothetical protein
MELTFSSKFLCAPFGQTIFIKKVSEKNIKKLLYFNNTSKFPLLESYIKVFLIY